MERTTDEGPEVARPEPNGSIVVSFFRYQAVICKAELGVSWFLQGVAGDAGRLAVE